MDRELGRLAAAIVAGGELEPLILTLKQREAERDKLRRELAALDRAGKAAHLDPKAVERELRAKLADWRTLLRKHIPQARQVLSRSCSQYRSCFHPSETADSGTTSFKHRSRWVGFSAD